MIERIISLPSSRVLAVVINVSDQKPLTFPETIGIHDIRMSYIVYGVRSVSVTPISLVGFI